MTPQGEMPPTVLYDLLYVHAIGPGQHRAKFSGHKAAGGLRVEPRVVAGCEISYNGCKIAWAHAAAAHAALEDADGHVLHQRVHGNLHAHMGNLYMRKQAWCGCREKSFASQQDCMPCALQAMQQPVQHPSMRRQPTRHNFQ